MRASKALRQGNYRKDGRVRGDRRSRLVDAGERVRSAKQEIMEDRGGRMRVIAAGSEETVALINRLIGAFHGSETLEKLFHPSVLHGLSLRPTPLAPTSSQRHSR